MNLKMSRPNDYFRFKQFTVHQDKCAMKVNTDTCIFGTMIDHPNPHSILDIGTGTGVLALMMAQRFPIAQINAVELDDPASQQAQENFNKSPWKERIKNIHASIQEFAEVTGTRYDLIISNPPWFTEHPKSPDSKKNLARHNDLLPFNDLARCIQCLLSGTGIFFITLPSKESRLFKDIMTGNGFLTSHEFRVQSGPANRSGRIIYGFTKLSLPLIKSEFIIHDEAGNYSGDFINRLRDFYLAF